MTNKAEEARRAWQALTRIFLSPEAHDRFHEATEAVGLPHPGSLRALLTIGLDPPSMREVAEEMNCDASYVTSLVDTLERAGYVERRPSEADRRVKLIELTDEGYKAQRRAFDVIETPSKAFDQLTAAELRTLAELLERVDREQRRRQS